MLQCCAARVLSHGCTPVHAFTHPSLVWHSPSQQADFMCAHRLCQLQHGPSALPPLGAWAHVTDLSGAEDMDVDPLHMDPLQAAALPAPSPVPCALPSGTRCSSGGGGGGGCEAGQGAPQPGGFSLAACMRSWQPGQLQQPLQQGCFQMRSGRYGRRAGAPGTGAQQQQQQEDADQWSLDIPPEHAPAWMDAITKGLRHRDAAEEGRWHITTDRRLTNLGYRCAWRWPGKADTQAHRILCRGRMPPWMPTSCCCIMGIGGGLCLH